MSTSRFEPVDQDGGVARNGFPRKSAQSHEQSSSANRLGQHGVASISLELSQDGSSLRSLITTHPRFAIATNCDVIAEVSCLCVGIRPGYIGFVLRRIANRTGNNTYVASKLIIVLLSENARRSATDGRGESRAERDTSRVVRTRRFRPVGHSFPFF